MSFLQNQTGSEYRNISVRHGGESQKTLYEIVWKMSLLACLPHLYLHRVEINYYFRTRILLRFALTVCYPIAVLPPLTSWSFCIRFKTLIFAYKAKNGPASAYLTALTTTRSLWSSITAQLISPSLKVQGRPESQLFLILGPWWWNDLSLNNQTSESRQSLKT